MTRGEEIAARIRAREERLDMLTQRIRNLPDIGDMLELRQILEQIVETLR